MNYELQTQHTDDKDEYDSLLKSKVHHRRSAHIAKKSAGKFSAAETCRVTSSCLASFGMHLQRFLAQAAGLEARKIEKTKLQKAFGKL